MTAAERRKAKSPATPAAAPVAAAPVAAAPVAPSPPPPSDDLLDMMSFADPEVAAPPLPPAGSIDILSAAPAATAAPADDPFGTLLEPAMDMPVIYSFNGNSLTPLNVDTAGFGGQWGKCPHTNKVIKNKGGKITTLDDFMGAVSDVGGFGVEAISKTNEAIAAGVIGGDVVVLFHCKLHSNDTYDVTVKSSSVEASKGVADFLEQVW